MEQQQLQEVVREARVVFADYIQELLDAYAKRAASRRRDGLPVLSFVGHGRSGKDLAASLFAKHSPAVYNGSTSRIVCPMIAWSQGLNERDSFERRHDDRDFWFRWCCEFRRDDPAVLAKMLLGKSDICVGVRAKAELDATVANDVVNVVVWVKREGVPIDPTMEFSEGRVLQLPAARRCLIENNESIDFLSQQVQRIARYYNLTGDTDG